jgi:hypothetical protein
MTKVASDEILTPLKIEEEIVKKLEGERKNKK